jgi:hypothetical protein
MNFQFEDLTTGAGIAAAAAAAMVLIQILKAAIPGIFVRITGAAWITFLLAVLYVVAGFVVAAPPGATPANFYLALFLSWAACVTAALGLYQAATNGIEFQRSQTPPALNTPSDGPIR